MVKYILVPHNDLPNPDTLGARQDLARPPSSNGSRLRPAEKPSRPVCMIRAASPERIGMPTRTAVQPSVPYPQAGAIGSGRLSVLCLVYIQTGLTVSA